ncbi:methyltransferase [Candidatus Woesearchaeota archaeon]|jgi:putative methylase|nr:methyltransferase [Candidatus Woesearchaeota archaeon]
MITKSALAIQLSKLNVFTKAKVRLEQYPTDSEIAATMLWDAYMQGHIEDKILADLGSGTGILGIGAILLGAKHVYFVDADREVLDILRENIARLEIPVKKYKVLNKKISEINIPYYVQIKADVVIQNPPFGTKEKHIDKQFLEKAFTIAPVVYSLHKLTSDKFITAVARDNGFKEELINKFEFPIKASMKHHKKKVEKVKVGCWRLMK